jgi:hypothetical protein
VPDVDDATQWGNAHDSHSGSIPWPND